MVVGLKTGVGDGGCVRQSLRVVDVCRSNRKRLGCQLDSLSTSVQVFNLEATIISAGALSKSI